MRCLASTPARRSWPARQHEPVHGGHCSADNARQAAVPRRHVAKFAELEYPIEADADMRRCSRIVAGLEADELVTRTTDQSDTRAVTVTITDQGIDASRRGSRRLGKL